MVLHRAPCHLPLHKGGFPEVMQADRSVICKMRLFYGGVCTDFAPRVGARAVYRAREGIGGSDTKSVVQIRFAADARPSRRRGRRRPTRGYVRTSSPHFCRAEGAGDHWSPLQNHGEVSAQNRGKSVHKDNRITRKRAYFNDLFAYSVVGATSGRPLYINRSDIIKNAFPAQTFDYPQSSIRRENQSLCPSQKVLKIPKGLS